MTEHISTTIRRFARSSTHRSTADLPSPIQTVVDDALSPLDRSLPVALCTVAGECSAVADAHGLTADAARLEAVLEPVREAVRFLEGYVRLRLAGSTTDRDTAVLASDYLHARAYAAVADSPIPDDRLVDCYRLLTRGSTALARRSYSELETESAVSPRVDAEATSAGVAGALGVAAVGGTTETRRCLRRYSYAVMSALAAQSSAATDDFHPRATAVNVLSGRPATRTRVVEERAPVEHADSTVATALERARDALESLAVDDADGRPLDGASSPLVRLERATRLPFQIG